jgi:hypothetical protein
LTLLHQYFPDGSEVESLQKGGAGSAPKGVSADMLDQLIQEGQELRTAFDKAVAPIRNITFEDLKRR